MNIRVLEPAQAELEIRRCRLRRFPYSEVYTQEGAELLVLAIAHQHRKPGYWRNRLN